tara:strand:+ start:2088 stop:3911 length:1824 start_codon:yes stop_codon:yes gene_type:complete
MVERYPVYKSQLGISSLPSVDYTQLKEQSKNFSNVADAMAKMSNYFFKEAGDAAAIEGAEYGASQAVTKEQLEMAASTGIEPDVLKDDYSIFGKAARDAAILAGSNNMEAQAKRSFVEIVTAGLQNGTPSGEIQKQLDSVTLGFSNALMEVSPIAAQKLNATLSVSASSAWQSYANDEIAQNAKRDKAALTFLADDFLDNGLPGLIDTGTTIEGGINAVYQIQKRNIIFKTFGVDIRGASDSFTTKISDAFDAKYLEHRKNSIAKWVVSDEDSISDKNYQLATGNITDPRIADIYSTLTIDERNTLRTELIDQQDQRYNLINKAQELKDKENLREIKKLKSNFYEQLIFNKDDKAAEKILLDIKILDSNDDHYSSLVKDFNSKDTFIKSDKDTLARFETRLLSNRLDFAQVAIAYEDKLINTADYEKYLGKVIAMEDKNVKAALTIAKSELGLDDSFIVYGPGGKPVTTEQRKLLAFITNKLTREYVELKKMPLDERIQSPLTNDLGQFDAVRFVNEKLDALVDKQSKEMQEGYYKEFKNIANFHKLENRGSYDKEEFEKKADFDAYTKADLEKLLATMHTYPSKEKRLSGYKRQKALLERLITEME